MSNDSRVHFAPFALDRANECLWRGERAIKLRPKAFAVLDYLLSRPGELVTKQHLIDAVWRETFVGDAVLKVAIRQIREALADDPRAPRFIETAHRRGYRFIGEISASVDGARPQKRAPTSGPSRLIDAPAGFVGRAQALSRLQAWFDRARAGECQVVFVTGEAGIGKTTLLETFARRVAPERNVRICTGQCLAQYGMSEAYLPVLDALTQLGRNDGQVVDALRVHAPMWLMQLPSLVTVSDRALFRHDAPGATRERMLREMGEALDALTAHTTLVLVLEDLHWSDFSTLDLISYVARRRRPAHLMLVGTYRPAELAASSHPLKRVKQELIARHDCHELSLDYLTKTAVGQHLALRFPVNQFPGELAALIHERTNGQPLFMVNTIDHLMAERMIQAEGDVWRLTAPIDAIKVGVPDSIRQLIETQFDRLDARDQRILEAASVSGVEFSTMAASAGADSDVTDVETRCETLSARQQFLKACGTQLLPSGQTVARFGFAHAVYRHVLYQRLSASRRILMHRQIGLRGEEMYGDHTELVAAELAMHFEQASDYTRAARYLHQAAVNALRRSAYRQAIDLARRGLHLLEPLPDTDARARQELQLLITLGVTQIVTQGYAASDVGSGFLKARELCKRLGPIPELSEVLWGLWVFHILRAELSKALDISSEFLQLAKRITYPGMALRGHLGMQSTCTHQAHFQLALEHLAQALSLDGTDQERNDVFVAELNPEVAVRGYAAWLLWFIGQPHRALVAIQQAVTLAQSLSQPHSLAHARAFAALFHQLRRERPLAQRYAEEAIALSDEHGLPLYNSMARVIRGWALIGRGSDRQAAEQIRQGLSAWHSTGAQLMRPHFLALLAEAEAHLRRDDHALTLLEEAVEVAEATGERCYLAELHRLKGECLLTRSRKRGWVEAAAACFEQALAIAREQRALSLELRAAMSLARLHRNRAASAPRDLILPVFERFEEGFDTPDLLEARRLLDLCANC